MKEWTNSQIKILETRNSDSPKNILPFGKAEGKSALTFHRQIMEYKKTPLISLPNLAKKWNVKDVYIKDESKRFSLNAFKGLGGSYAMFRILCEKLGLDPSKTSLKDLTEGKNRARISKIEFATCTDGNHGKGVSWAAGIFGCRAHVYMPYGSQEVRAEAIRKAGPAEVEITEKSYDDTVQYAREISERNGWILIQDTAWKGYEKIPAWIIQGYLTMASEITDELDDLKERPTHLFLQAGVGAMAGGVLSYFADHYGEYKPVVTIVEPDVADCIYRSARSGRIYSVDGAPKTIMAGLNCGTPCEITWPIIRDYAEFCISGTDEMAEDGMRIYAKGAGSDPKIISGESGAATLGAANRILTESIFTDVRHAMGIDNSSVLLFINTEGDTDPVNYRRVVFRDYV